MSDGQEVKKEDNPFYMTQEERDDVSSSMRRLQVIQGSMTVEQCLEIEREYGIAKSCLEGLDLTKLPGGSR